MCEQYHTNNYSLHTDMSYYVYTRDIKTRTRVKSLKAFIHVLYVKKGKQIFQMEGVYH